MPAGNGSFDGIIFSYLFQLCKPIHPLKNDDESIDRLAFIFYCILDATSSRSWRACDSLSYVIEGRSISIYGNTSKFTMFSLFFLRTLFCHPRNKFVPLSFHGNHSWKSIMEISWTRRARSRRGYSENTAPSTRATSSR